MTVLKKTFLAAGTAAVLWFIMFSPWTAPFINFWKAMAISCCILILMSVFLSGGRFKDQFIFSKRDIIAGILSAGALWIIFFLGNYFSSILFDFAGGQVQGIYSMKTGENLIFLGPMLVLLIGPAEEIFWRGLIQKSFTQQFGGYKALFITTLIYALVHIWSFNFMLIMAAMVCGLFWGLIYIWNKNLVTLIVSHGLWDLAVFILFPIGQN